MSLRNIILALASTAVIGVHADSPPQGSVVSSNFTYSGAGCPQGSIGYSLSPDYTQIMFLFDQFSVNYGEGVSVTDARKTCTVGLSLDVPSGYSFTTSDVFYFGRSDLDKGYTGQLIANRSLGNDPTAQDLASLKVNGPQTGYFNITATPTPSLTSQCGGTSDINHTLRLRVTSTSSEPIGTLDGPPTFPDSTQGSYFYSTLRWQSCTS